MTHSPGVTARQCEQITFGRVWMLAMAFQRGIQAIKGAALRCSKLHAGPRSRDGLASPLISKRRTFKRGRALRFPKTGTPGAEL
jgi:hypothetical protein